MQLSDLVLLAVGGEEPSAGRRSRIGVPTGDPFPRRSLDLFLTLKGFSGSALCS